MTVTETRVAKKTTHDLITDSLTVQAPPNQIGDSQIFKGEEWLWNGKRWFRAVEVEQGNNG